MDNQNTKDSDSKKKVARIEIDRSLCIGAASCISITPEVFELDSEAKAVVKDKTAATSEAIIMAAQSCPTKAILLYGEDGELITLD